MQEPETGLLANTLEVWQPRTFRPLTLEDARQITENATGFVRTLQQWAEVELNSTDPASNAETTASLTSRGRTE